MRIVYVGAKYDYGKQEQGYSFEHCNLFESLRRVTDEILYFDFPTLMREIGQSSMNRRLAEVIQSEQPDVMFTVLFQDWLDFTTIRKISDTGTTRTVNWFSDDHWNYEGYSSRWAPAFNWVVTTAQTAVPKYERDGHRNVIKSQWACNQFLYRKLDLPLKYDVTFVDQPYGIRRPVIEALTAAGFNVQCWGTGWPNGRLSPEEMIAVFNQSRINLGFVNAIYSSPPKGTRIDRITRRFTRMAADLPGIRPVYRAARRVLRHGLAKPMSRSTVLADRLDQIKGRTFEVPGCGGLLLTGPADNLEEYYTIGKQIMTFTTLGELIDTVRHLLDHEEERAAVALSGYRRTLSEHTYLHRFRDIFRTMGLDTNWPEDGTKPAKVVDITADMRYVPSTAQYSS
jgi:spore maturation protein CgeB